MVIILLVEWREKWKTTSIWQHDSYQIIICSCYRNRTVKSWLPEQSIFKLSNIIFDVCFHDFLYSISIVISICLLYLMYCWLERTPIFKNNAIRLVSLLPNSLFRIQIRFLIASTWTSTFSSINYTEIFGVNNIWTRRISSESNLSSKIAADLPEERWS